MDDDAASLLAAVLAAPDDDAPRLVYADHLAERGDPRGELIHVQCRAARMLEGPERRFLEQRAAVLIQTHRTRWVPSEVVARFVRGFVEEVAYDGPDAASAFLADAPRWWARTPLRALTLRAGQAQGGSPGGLPPADAPLAPGSLERLAASPWLGRLRELTIRAEYGGGDQALGASVHVAGLERLTANAVFGDAGVRALAASPYALRLRSLRLRRGSALEAGGVLALAERRALPALEELELPPRLADPSAVAAFAASPATARLRRLGLAETGIDAACARALAASPHVGGLTVAVSVEDVGEAGLLALAASPALGGVEVHAWTVAPAAAVDALRARYGERLTVLDRGRGSPPA